MTDKTPVTSGVYDDAWLTSAWGEKANRHLLSDAPLRPRPRLQRAVELAQLRPGQSLLDIACGRGELVALAAELGVKGVGIDFSESSLRFAASLKEARKKRVLPQGDLQLIRADACRLPFPDKSFDRIMMLDIVEHLIPEQLESMFHEVRRLLRPNGYAVVHTLPNRWFYDITYAMARLAIRKLPKDPRGEIEKSVHVNEQDLPKLHRMLAHCGLRHRIWLEQHIPAQARWNYGADYYGDNRDKVYPRFAGFGGRLLEWISLTPAKLLLSNDIFGILWPEGLPAPAVKMPFALTERLICALTPHRQQP